VGAGKAFLYVFLASTADSLIRGASFEDAVKGGLISGATAAAFIGLGSAFDGAGGFWGSAVVQQASYGVVGGISNTLQGGKFGHGFFSAALSGPVTRELIGDSSNPFRILFARMLVGGAVSEATGGKFKNGAASAAFLTVVGGLTANVAQSSQPNNQTNSRTWELWRSCVEGESGACSNLEEINNQHLEEALSFIKEVAPALLDSDFENPTIVFNGDPDFVIARRGDTHPLTDNIRLSRAYNDLGSL